MRLSVMIFDPHVPDTLTAILSIFSFYFNDIERFAKLATNSMIKSPPRTGDERGRFYPIFRLPN
jgi:hypothetical protein